MARKKKETTEALPEVGEGLVRVYNPEGDFLDVHPSTLASHLDAGWEPAE